MVVEMIPLKAATGCRLVLPDGGYTLDGIGIVAGADMPDEGAWVAPGVWTRKRLDEGDAVTVPPDIVAAAQKRAEARELPEKPTKKSTDTGAQV